MLLSQPVTGENLVSGILSNKRSDAVEAYIYMAYQILSEVFVGNENKIPLYLYTNLLTVWD